MCKVEGQAEPWEIDRVLGQVPVIIKSKRCYLANKSPREHYIAVHEEAEEMGGYFIINGNEKVMRILIMPRRNHIMAIRRPTFSKRGPESFRVWVSNTLCCR